MSAAGKKKKEEKQKNVDDDNDEANEKNAESSLSKKKNPSSIEPFFSFLFSFDLSSNRVFLPLSFSLSLC